MNETLLIIERLEALRKIGEKAALATVVRTFGSTYRKEGAKMIITEKGDMIGSISAGCLESDVCEVAPEVINTGKPKLLKYDNTAAEEIIWGLGLGCNGIVEVFVEPLLEERRAISAHHILNYVDLVKAVERENPFALATVIRNESERDIQLGQKMLVCTDGKVIGNLGETDLEDRVMQDARELLSKEKSRTLSYQFESSKGVEVYIESICSPPPLVIIGGDPDAVPIVNLAKQLGFNVTLVDHRPNIANSEKYPEASATVVASSEEVTEKILLNEKTFVLIKTHNYLKDKEILQQVLKSQARYVGQLGPKARTDDLLKDLSKEGAQFSKEELAKLHAPAGLDVAAESPEEIALSILAEIVAVRNDRQGGFLKNQTQAIHPRD